MDQENVGSNLNVLNNYGPFQLANKDYPAIVIFPQCPSNSRWIHVATKIKGLIDYAVQNYNVDVNKVALTGFSWGGTGAWEIGLKYPNVFSCIVPVSPYSSIEPENGKYPDCPVWVFGSSADGTKKHVDKIQDLLQKSGKKVKTEIYADEHSTVQVKAYSSDLINWMIERSRATNSRYQF